MKNLYGKKILIIVANQDFQDDEYRTISERLSFLGAELDVASSSIGLARGINGASVNCSLLVSDINLYEYDAVVFIGGPGSVEYQSDASALELVRQLVQQKKVVGAICLAPLILAKANVLRGREATVWPDYENENMRELTSAGAKYTGEPVTVDKKIITANGPEAATEFADALAKEL
ncbi:DJ-1/PfpI family protein [Candidatus Kuenenbacteria bacterium]|nr:DJ-1/PfpI family protein [Candidatus Kuenenbacteria bacterium]